MEGQGCRGGAALAMGGASAGKFESRRFSGQISREIVKIFLWIFPCENENNEMFFFIFLFDSLRYQPLPRTFLLLDLLFLGLSLLGPICSLFPAPFISDQMFSFFVKSSPISLALLG